VRAPLVEELGLFSTPLLARDLHSAAGDLPSGDVTTHDHGAGGTVYVKNEAVLPTGSYKDRGARTLIGACRVMGIRRVVEDSSGNAGAAVAAYAAAAGMGAEVFVKEGAAPGKLRQIQAYGALLRRISGTREDVARAAQERAAALDEEAAYYASHVYNPLFMHGIESAADEIVKEIGMPGAVYLPAGNGALLLGLAAGFRRHGGLPRMIAVQAQAFAPLYREFFGPGSASTAEIRAGTTIADGIAVAAPARLAEMARVVHESGGTVVTVSDAAVREAQEVLGRTGLYAEPTGAVAAAGYRALSASTAADTTFRSSAPQVVFLTGSGLKEQP
jgi:threonine synthase